MREENNKFLQFKLASADYLISLDHVIEVVKECEIQKLPYTLPEVLGAIYFRGEIVAVIDLALALSIPSSQDQSIIVFSYENFKLGFMVEKVVGVIDEITADAPKILEIPEFMKRYAA